MKSAEEIKTFCPECGPNIAIDEDGSCHTCGNGAFGQGIEKINLLIRQAREEVREEIVNQVAAACKARPDGKPCGLCNDFMNFIGGLNLK